MAAVVATGANAQILPPGKGPRLGEPTTKGPRPSTTGPTMDQIIQGADRVLQHIENNGQQDNVVCGYIRLVKRYTQMPNGVNRRGWLWWWPPSRKSRLTPSG